MVHVKDQQKAKAFYLRLGFHVVAEAPMGNGETWLQMGLPNGGTTLALMPTAGVILETGDIAKESARLGDMGIPVGKIDDTPFGRFLWLKDEDGNGLCLHQK